MKEQIEKLETICHAKEVLDRAIQQGLLSQIGSEQLIDKLKDKAQGISQTITDNSVEGEATK